jgi:dihydrofolate reductase
MALKLIIAIDRGNAIGWKDGRLPWRLPADLKRFKHLTIGNTVVMGRKTYESLRRPAGLPDRTNIVVTSASLDAVATRGSLNGVLLSSRDEDIFLIGGAGIYNEALERGLPTELLITLVDADSGGDVQLDTDLSAWKHFIVKEAAKGRFWGVKDLTHQQDGAFSTAYLHLVRTTV